MIYGHARQALSLSVSAREFDRLLAVAARRNLGLWWVSREYAALFDEIPAARLALLPEQVRRHEYQRLLQKGAERGYAIGWAMHRYRATMGVWPEFRWRSSRAA